MMAEMHFHFLPLLLQQSPRNKASAAIHRQFKLLLIVLCLCIILPHLVIRIRNRITDSDSFVHVQGICCYGAWTTTKNG